MESILKRVWRLNLPLAAILLLGLALRLWGIDFGLPYMYHADENVPVSIALRMLRTGNLNPEFFNWPSLLMYLNALAYFIFFLFGRLLGRFSSPADLPFPEMEAMAVGRAALPEIILLGRGLSVGLSIFSVLVVYLIGREMFSSRAAGWIAAALFAVESVSVKNSHFIRPDTPAVFFALVAALFALKILDDPRSRNYVLAGASAGLAASSKYNLALIFVAILAAHLVRFGLRGFIRKELFLSMFAGGVAFVLTTPYAILDFARFWQIGPLDDAAIYSTGHPGAEGNTFQWYVDFLWSTQGVILLLAIGGALWIIFRRERKGIVLLSFPLVYYLFVNLFTVHFDTTILPVIPFIILLASVFILRACDFFAHRWHLGKVWLTAAMLAIVLILAWTPLQATAANNAHISQPDGREQAREWIDANLPPGSRVAIESYSPYIDRHRFTVEGLYGIQDHSADWYVSNGFEYLVFSQGVYERFFDDPARYAVEVSRYNALFSRFQQVARFDDNGFEIRIYKTGVTLPAHRVAARFGDYGEHVELIGYGDVQWKQGEPLQMRLTWRTLDETPEPYEVELRLLGQDDREIAKTRSDLFQGKGWQTGMFDGTWAIPIPPETTPGQYRLQVNVIWMRYAYVMPALSWTQQRVDPVILEPIEMQARP